MPFDLLRQLPNHVDLGRLALALHEPPHDLVQPVAALAARCALKHVFSTVALARRNCLRHCDKLAGAKLINHFI